ncbi:uncharacterized protein LOC141853997 [Brevipalpus obovatus]|uniref:uncharacterized protein LOC141853997 n=1 Tax=Brevipalpus obovatus TaxID=246614 RepID=UPI003D9E217F
MPAPSQAETTVISSLRIPKIKNTSQMSNSSSSLVLTKQELQELIENQETLHKQVLRLHSILERTSKAVGDITKKHDGREWRGQTYKDNIRLQQDTEKIVHELREEMSEIKKIALAKEPDIPEESNEAATSSPTSTSMLEEENQYDASEVFSTSAPRNEFFDPGSHWCSQCNEIHSDLDGYLKHLHSKSHSDKIDPNEQAWISKRFCKPKPKVSSDKPLETIQIKGSHFILPIKGYFCKICEVFMASVAHAEDHLKTKDHDRLYNRYVLLNQNYKQKYGVDKARAMNKILNEKKRKREQEEREERERENKKRQQEAEQRRRERILREKTDEENRLKAKAQREARESAERDREREKEKETKLLRAKERLMEKYHQEKNSKAALDCSGDSFVDFHKSIPQEKVKTEPTSFTVPDGDDEKLSMRLVVDIPKSEWQPCFYKVLKRMIMREVSDATEKAVQDRSNCSDEENLINPRDSRICSQEEPAIDSPSSSSEALSSQVPLTPDLHSNDCDNVLLTDQKQGEKNSIENCQDDVKLKFSMEEDDDEEIEMNSWQINEAIEASPISVDENTSRWSISSQEDSLPNDSVKLEIEQRIVIYPEKSKEENEERLGTSFSQIDQPQLNQDSYLDFEDLRPTLILDPPLTFGPNQLDLTSPDSTHKNSINDILNFLLTP